MSSILVVDDDPVSRVVLRVVLERHDHQVIEAGGVVQAQDVLAAESVDLIICDYEMPDLNGLDLLEQMGESTIPFILLTGTQDRSDLADDRVDGVSGYLTKPASSEELIRVVDEHSARVS